MPTYQGAVPFDIIQDILDMQADIKRLQIQMPAPYVLPTFVGPWTTATLAGTWVGTNVTTVDGLFYRYWNDPFNVLEMMGNVINVTGSGTLNITTVPTAPSYNQNHDIMNNTTAASRAWLWAQSTGVIQIINYTANTELGIHAMIPMGLV